MINAIENIKNRMDQVEEISELGDRNFEIIYSEWNKEERM